MLDAATCTEALEGSKHVRNAAAACAELFTTLQRRRLSEDASFATFDDVQDWVYLSCVIVVVACAAMAAGLTMGVTSLESSELRVIARTGTPTEKRQAATLLPLVERRPHHQVLVTLLLCNSLANEASPIFVDKLAPTWAAVLFSVVFVLVFGEILPSAVFTGPSQLRAAALCAPLVKGVLITFSPITYPISLVLDHYLPEEDDLEEPHELVARVEVGPELAQEHGTLPLFTKDESNLVRGVMALRRTTVADVYVPLHKVATVSAHAPLTLETLKALRDAGHSRMPLRWSATPGDWRDFVLVKELVGSPPEPKALKSTGRAIRTPHWVSLDMPLPELLDLFQGGRSHVAFVSRNPARAANCLAHEGSLGISATPKSKSHPTLNRNHHLRSCSTPPLHNVPAVSVPKLPKGDTPARHNTIYALRASHSVCHSRSSRFSSVTTSVAPSTVQEQPVGSILSKSGAQWTSCIPSHVTVSASPRP